MMKIFKKSLVSPVSLLAIGMMAGCASSGHDAKRDLMSDPSRFESLASGAYESPTAAPVVAAAVVAAPPAFEADAIKRAPAAVAEETIATPDAAYAAVLRGNERFVTGAVKGEHRDVERRRALASGQQPHTIVLSCSDSRVPPELIFDQGLGDLFTIRVAGEVLGSAQVASIEYAIEHLKAKLIVVLGHESCGAVKAALGSSGKHASAGSTDLDWLVSSIKPNLGSREIASVSTEPDTKLRKPVMSNVDAVTSQLLVRSKIISEAMEKGNLKVVKGIYGLDSGRVDFWGMK